MSNTTSTQPSLSTLLVTAGDRATERLRVAIPAVVISFDADTMTCAAQPLIAHPRKEGGSRSDAPVGDVPVLYPGTMRSQVRFPLAKGDQVLLVFLDRASDDWALALLTSEVSSPKEKRPAERRFHDLTDCIAIPFCTAVPANRAVAIDRLVVRHGDVTLALTDAGEALVHDGVDGEAVALATKADVQALVTWAKTHTHSGVTTGPGASGVPVAPLPGNPDGTSVLKGK
ncbi:MAG: Gp138 family membrane-puncturing spike protein [Pseudomonadota bacterium]